MVFAPVWEVLYKIFCHLKGKLNTFKGSIVLKNDIFIQERFYKLIYSINMIIKYGLSQPVKFQLVSRFEMDQKWNDFFYRISGLMLATFIPRYDKNHFILRMRDAQNFYSLSGAPFYDCINTIYQFIKLFLDNKKSTFEGYGAFKGDNSAKIVLALVWEGIHSKREKCVPLTSKFFPFRVDHFSEGSLHTGTQTWSLKGCLKLWDMAENLISASRPNNSLLIWT